MDIDGRGELTIARDSERLIEICSSEWTLSDVPERPWMVGRVGIEPTTNGLRETHHLL